MTDMKVSLYRQRELAITWRDPASLRPRPGNPRHHPRDQVRKLRASIREFGFTNPILVDENDVVLCGHGRLQASIAEGLDKVPVIALAHLTEAQRRAYVIADNALAEKAGWSKDLLRSELEGLVELGYEIELTGFDTVEIDSLLSLDDDHTGSAGDAQEDEQVELPGEGEPLSRLGDHWTIGRHHLLVADARKPASYRELLGDTRVECTFTDPPYNTPARNISGLGKVRHGDFVMGSGELTRDAFTMELLRPVMENIVRVSRPGAIAFFCSDWRTLGPLWEAAEGVFVEPKNLVVWAKTNAGMGGFYRQQTEFVIPFQVSKGEVINNMRLAPGKRYRSTLWTYAGCNTFRRGRMEDLADHPTVKPRRLVADALLDVSRPGSAVLDPFLGSGTTLAAAEVTGRTGYGIELDPAYADVTLRRLAKVTGETPRLVDGTAITDVAAARGQDWQEA